MCSYALNSCIINTTSWRKARVCSIDIQRVVSLLITQISVAMVTYTTFDLLYQQLNLKV